MVQDVSLNEEKGLKNPVYPSRTNSNKFFPIAPKYTPNKPGILTIVKGCNEVYSSKNPVLGKI